MDSSLIIGKEEKATFQTTWKIYKSQWKSFLTITGLCVLAYIIYNLIEFTLSLLGLAPLVVSQYEYEYVGTSSLILAWIIRSPIYIVYSILTSFLNLCFMVIPVLYFHNREIVSWKAPFIVLKKNFIRFFLGGLVYTVATIIGLIPCGIGSLAVALTGPTFVHKITCSDTPVLKAFSDSFQSVFKSTNLWSYIGLIVLAYIIFYVATVCTCIIGGIITFPLLSIYALHITYNKGIIN